MTGDVFDWCFHGSSMSLFFEFAYASTYGLGVAVGRFELSDGDKHTPCLGLMPMCLSFRAVFERGWHTSSTYSIG